MTRAKCTSCDGFGWNFTQTMAHAGGVCRSTCEACKGTGEATPTGCIVSVKYDLPETDTHFQVEYTLTIGEDS